MDRLREGMKGFKKGIIGIKLKEFCEEKWLQRGWLRRGNIKRKLAH